MAELRQLGTLDANCAAVLAASEPIRRDALNAARDTGKTVAAHPFVRPGFDESIDGAMDIVETTVLDDAVEKFG